MYDHRPKNPKASRFRGNDGAVHLQGNISVLMAACEAAFAWREVEYVSVDEPLTCIGCMAKEK